MSDLDQLIADVARTIWPDGPLPVAADYSPEPTADIARVIDHTLLRPDATPAQIDTLCDEARAYHFATVCVNPVNVAQATQRLEGSDVEVCTVVGFPLGATPPAVKAFETARTIADGATEVDMVINIGALKAGDYQTVFDDIAAVVEAAHTRDAWVKVIIEAALLTDDEKVAACLLAKAAGADYVKTSTGFGPGGATTADVALMRRTVGPTLGVKAAGGIKTYEDAQAMLAAGASRLGASAGVTIVEAFRS